MIRDITIGQFYPVDSIIHILDARIKIIATFIYIISLFIMDSFIAYGFVILALALVIKSSKVPLSFMLRGIKSIFIIILFTAFLNVFTTTEGNVIFKAGFITITSKGVYMAVLMCLRLVLLIVGSSLMTLTTTPIQLTDGIEYILRPLKKIGVPSHEIAMMMTIALRFIPILLDETDKIMKAQQARGADFDTGNIIQKAKSLVPILVPLFISAFRRADELAMAMEARCYNGAENRTRMNVMHFQSRDYKALVVVIIYTVLSFVLRYIF
ncbi:transporter [Tyzzerella sp. An114]|uniref:energy-coupling factor transporter transmembrane component T family protein n=1 Tax=Tyzzerella sp. An114 TaxID=1965545 RepID=UPI000B44049D|nr:energy-coupling factor transporter transmembrane component T [Tyzzerella sp. An114]OUQ58475.1 transporter [Tyzzerella sp. An114]